MSYISVKGLSAQMIAKLLPKKDPVDIAYADIRCVVYVATSDNTGRILFDGRETWNYDFNGSAEDFLRKLTG